MACDQSWIGYVQLMRLAVLDIGSNCAQCQIVDASPGAPPLPIHALRRRVLLADEIDSEGVVSEIGTDRVVAATVSVMEAARHHGVDQLYPFVTAAIRDAPNRDHVLDRIAAETGVRPQFLSGEQEARLTYIAVHRWYGWCSGRVLVLDIGGGSTEIALGRDAEPDFVVSLPLGARQLTSMFFTSDPPRRGEIKAMKRYVGSALRETADRLMWEGEPRRVVGTSKTFKQLARLCGAPPQRHGPFARRTLTKRDVRQCTAALGPLKADERAALRGVSRHRSGQILAGAIVAQVTMTTLRVRELEVSPWALREGVILQHLSTLTRPAETLPLQPIRTERDAGASVTSLVHHSGTRDA